MTATSPSVWIVIPTWNGWDNVNDCLQTVARQTFRGLSVIVVDNGSSDGTPEKLAQAWPDVRVIRFEDNTGFTGACNAGMARALEAGADYVMLVNNDTLLDPGMVAHLVAAAEAHPDAALFNPLIGYADRRDTVWANGNVLSLFTALGDGADDGRPVADVAREGIKRVHAATGCIFMARAAVMRELGLLLEDLFIYYEDADWSLRARAAGYSILAVPDALAWHKVSSDTKRNVDFSAWAYYYSIRNRLTLMRRHARWYHWAVFAPWFTGWAVYKLTGLAVLGRSAKRNAIVDGIRDAVSRNFPRTKYVPHG